MKTNFLCRNVLPRGWDILLKTFLIIASFSFHTAVYSQSCPTGEVCLTGKHIPRTTPNLIPNAAVNGQFTQDTSDWLHFEAWCHYDRQYPLWSDEPGHDGNPGCLILTGPDTNQAPNCNLNTQDMVRLFNVEIEPGGETHTLSVRCKTDSVCHSPVMMIQLVGYDSAGTEQKQSGNAFSNSTPGVWEEFSFSFRMPPEVTNMRIQISNHRVETEYDEDMVAYIDDLYLGKGVSFDDPPSCKVPFDGEGVKIDELGNFYVKNDNNEWEWFFPFIIHGDNSRNLHDPDYPPNDGWKKYSAQGFNTIITGNSNSSIDDAISAGLRVMPQLGHYYVNGAPLTDLENRLNHINSTHSINHDVLAYLIDNEKHERWDPMTATANKIMEWESSTSETGGRIAPIYMLNGTPGLAPKYLSQDQNCDKNCHVGDVTGTYISEDGYGKFPTNRYLRNLDHQHNQSMPASIAQINGTQSFRARIFGSIAAGARGMNYWRDFLPGHLDYIPYCGEDTDGNIINCDTSDILADPGSYPHLFDHLNDNLDNNNIVDDDYDGKIENDILNKFLDINGNLLPTNDITLTEWWDDFPSLVCKIYELQDVIEQPHWTEGWGVSSCVSNSQTCEDADFIIGTRQLGNDRYIIVANYGLDSVTADITFSGLPFTDGELTNVSFIQGLSNPAADSTVELTNSRAQITLPYDGFGVYIIEGQDNQEPSTSCLDNSIYVSGNLSRLYEAATITTNSNTDVLPGANAHLKGGQIVNLKPGFKVHRGATFKGTIEECSQQCETSCDTLSSFTRSIGACSVSSTGAKTSTEDESAIWVRHYPNPFRDEVSLEFSLDAEAEARITVSDVNGRIISQLPVTQINRGIQTLNISTKNWIPGIYFYQIQIREQNTSILSHANGTLVKM